MQTIDNKVRKRIYGSGRGSLFTPTDFADLGGRDAVDKVLSRLTAEGTLRRLSRGIYDYPKIHAVLGALSPAPEAVAKALTQRDAVKLQPAGAYAANVLGLSEQVPARIVFLTDGKGRTVHLGPTDIVLRPTTPRNVATAGRLSGLLIQAFRYLGRAHITSDHIEHLRRTIPAKERAKLLRDLRYAPEWMRPLFHELAHEG
jgi:hypothetical protein